MHVKNKNHTKQNVRYGFTLYHIKIAAVYFIHQICNGNTFYIFVYHSVHFLPNTHRFTSRRPIARVGCISKQDTGAKDFSVTFKIRPTVISIGSSANLYPPPFPRNPLIIPALLIVTIILSRYFSEISCQFCNIFKGIYSPLLFSARSTITRKAYLPLVEIHTINSSCPCNKPIMQQC